jgi:23S rRNA (cytidine2498-2'-O)-methyltransferase
VGAESAVKADVGRQWPESRFAFSRPGFLTFKLPAALAETETPPLRSVFARAVGWSLGKVEGASAVELADAAWTLARQNLQHVAWNRVHVWPRDLAAPGHRGFEPGITPESTAARDTLVKQAPQADVCTAGHTTEQQLTSTTGRGDRVLDCIVLEPGVWWLGHHRAWTRTQCWPGGFWPGTPPADIVSRAYLKMAEALDWSQLPIRPGHRAAEIGCAPGGASKALLDRGLHVLGIDPAEVAPAILAHPDFVHLRKRGADVRRRIFRGIRWLFADTNVTPQAALWTLESIVTHPEVHIRGLIVNIKLTDWNLSEEVPQYLARVRGWGFEHVQARQLGHNRQEVCIAAWR